MLPVAVDAMGGDNAPQDIVAGARAANEKLGIAVTLFGDPDALGDTGDLEVVATSEVIAMDAEPGSSVRRMKDASMVRAAEAVRDGAACAMVGAGNTGATMASALLRMGRIKGVQRPAIVTPIPKPEGTPTCLLDAGANAEVTPEQLLQFGQMGAVYARDRFNVEQPRVGLLSIGEEAGKGTPLVKESYQLFADADWGDATFVGNVEGRDLMGNEVDVVATDGFTGNVALKTLEGGMRGLITALLEAFADPAYADAAAQLAPALTPLYEKFQPDTYGGAMLLGLKGVCIISHGSSGPWAIENAIRVGAELAQADVVGHLVEAVQQA